MQLTSQIHCCISGIHTVNATNPAVEGQAGLSTHCLSLKNVLVLGYYKLIMIQTQSSSAALWFYKLSFRSNGQCQVHMLMLISLQEERVQWKEKCLKETLLGMAGVFKGKLSVVNDILQFFFIYTI